MGSPAPFVHERFFQNAVAHPERLALVAAGRRYTYGEVARQAAALAGFLLDGGLSPGDRVAIDLGNQASAIPAMWGTLAAGGTFVYLDPSTPFPRFAELLGDFRPHALLTRPERLEGLRAEDLPPLVLCDGSPAAPASRLEDVWREGVSPSTPPPLDADPERLLASLVYTSGSTGFPKGVMMTHASVGTAAHGIMTYLRASARDVVLCVLPLSFDYGHYQALMTGLTGACLVLEPGFGYPGALLERMREERITTLPGVPTLFALLLQLKTFRADRLPDLRVMTNTGAALGVTHVREIRRRFPAVRLYLMYGLTECKRVSYLPPEETDLHPASVGIAMPGCETAIVDGSGRPVPAGELGELVVRGRNLMVGYWERPEATAERLRPGPWPGEKCLYSGDLFRADAEGRLTFVGRRDDIIKSRGEKVAPSEVEHVLLELAGVTEAAVVGVDHPVLGSAIRAVVSLTEDAGLSPASLREHCALNLETYKVPHEFVVLPSLPRNERGKIDKTALRGALPPPPRDPDEGDHRDKLEGTSSTRTGSRS